MPAVRTTDPSASLELDDAGELISSFLAAPPRLALWRAPTDNDRIAGLAERWTAWGIDRLERTLDGVERLDGGVTIVRARYRTAAGCEIPVEQRLEALDGGGVRIRETATLPDELDDVARVGSTFETIAGLEDAEWFGLGPHETYPDRERGGQVGRWRSSVTDLAFPYVRPQETGLRTQVRWLELRAADGSGLRIELHEPLAVSATHHRAHDLAAATHDVEVRPRAETIVHVDAVHRGLGTASCGPDTLESYLVRPGTHHWTWEIHPLPRQMHDQPG